MRVQISGNAVANRDDGFNVVLAQSIYLAHAETKREVIVCGSATCSIPPPCGEVSARQRAGWGDFFDAGAFTPPGSAFGTPSPSRAGKSKHSPAKGERHNTTPHAEERPAARRRARLEACTKTPSPSWERVPALARRAKAGG